MTPLLLLALACPGAPPAPSATLPHPLERANGVDDDGDGEIDEVVLTDELDPRSLSPR